MCCIFENILRLIFQLLRSSFYLVYVYAYEGLANIDARSWFPYFAKFDFFSLLYVVSQGIVVLFFICTNHP